MGEVATNGCKRVYVSGPMTGCGEESMKSNDKLAETTCINCLKAAIIYGEGAAVRLQHLNHAAAKKNPDGSNKSFYDSGIKGMDGETAIRMFQEGRQP